MTSGGVHVRKPGWLAANLPFVMQEDDLVVRFVAIAETIAGTVRDGVTGIEHTADASVTSAPLLRWLGHWVSAPAVHGELDEDAQRRIVRAAGDALAHRGTARALRDLLAAVTGGRVEVEDPGAVARDGEAPPVGRPVVVRVAATGHLSTSEVVDLVRAEVPAHVPVVVAVAGRIVWPLDAAAAALIAEGTPS